jgi:predicted alpha-1,6-mannanase (GH76 family)
MVADTIVLDFMDEELWHLLAAEARTSKVRHIVQESSRTKILP